MQTILVTGAAGFIGSHVCEALLRRGDRVIGLDNFNTFYDPAIKRQNAAILEAYPHFEMVEGSTLDPAVREEVFGRAQFDAVLHLAAWAGVRPSIEKPALYQRENIEATVALMDEVRARQTDDGTMAKFVFASSSSVYGANKKVPFCETDNVDHPVSPYAATKKACELLAHTYHHLFGLRVTGLRFFTVYGPRQRPEMAIHKFTRRIVNGEPIPMFGDGTSARDYTYIDDIVAGTVAAIDHCSAYHVYNLGNSDTVSLASLIDTIGTALGTTPKVEQLPMQPGDVPLTYADISRAREELGYAPQTSIQSGVEKFVAWYREMST